MPLSSIYGGVIGLRNLSYDRGWLSSFHMGARTISVGNLTTGGTGKTPLVAYIAKLLVERGEKLCVLTRGYKREHPGQRVLVSDGETVVVNDPALSGDEPVELAQRLGGKAVIIADADRRSAGEWARERFGITAFILDDGFQHRQVKRDLDIVCVDATDPWGGDRVLPAGRLREPVAGLARADVVVLTRSDMSGDASGIIEQIRQLRSDMPVYRSSASLAGIRPLNSIPFPVAANEPALAFCGIGNPESFFDLLKRAGWDVVGRAKFRDHHRYTQADIDRLHAEAGASGAHVLLTTAKDGVKLSTLRFELPCGVVDLDLTIDRTDEFNGRL